jgi:DNA polymerase-3 subunit epsilon
MIVLAVDVETTGLDPNTDEVIEIAYCLHDLFTKKDLYTFSGLVRGVKPIPPEIETLTGITNEMREKFGFDKETVKPNFKSTIDQAEYLAAHNAEFERGFLGKALGRWIDTTVDLPYPDHIQTRKLTHLCAEHGFAIQGAHRALHDVQGMLKLMGLYDPVAIRTYAESPNMLIQAVVSFQGKDEAKARGYRWDGDNKQWVKRIKEFQMEAELAAPFKVVVLEKC